MGRLPDYEEKDKAIQAECANDIVIKKARDEIFSDIVESIQYLKALRKSSEEGIVLKAIIEHFKLAGLYVEQIKHTGGLTITQEHANKVIQAGKLSRGEA